MAFSIYTKVKLCQLSILVVLSYLEFLLDNKVSSHMISNHISAIRAMSVVYDLPYQPWGHPKVKYFRLQYEGTAWVSPGRPTWSVWAPDHWDFGQVPSLIRGLLWYTFECCNLIGGAFVGGKSEVNILSLKPELVLATCVKK